MTSVAAAAGVFLLATLAPFEMTQPLVRLPWQAISNLEAVLLLALAAWAATLMYARRALGWGPHARLGRAGAAFLATMAIAAAVAPAARLNAWHMTGRLAAAAAVYRLTVDGLTSQGRLRTALSLSVASGVVVAALAMLESAQVGVVLRWLQAFRPSVSVVGAQIRAGGPLQYPTIASMYLEVVFAFGLGLLLAAFDASSRLRTVLWFLALVAIGGAITLTFTRAGLITMAASVLIVGAVRATRRGWEGGSVLLAALSVVVFAFFVSSRSAQSLWLRFTTEGQDTWYRARIDAPKSVSMATGDEQRIPIAVTNTGRLAWDSAEDPPILVSYHWLAQSGERVVAFNGARTAFDRLVEPGETATVHALVRAPHRPGAYQLEWDVLQEGLLWFSTEQGAPASTVSLATVTGEPSGESFITTDRPRPAVRPGRLVLWRAAARMIAAHPFLGVGPDNFRLLYGPYAGLQNADPRTHSNSMYLEVLVSGGLVAAIAFVWFLREAVTVFVSICKSVDPGHVAVAAAGVAIALHALFDSFISFAPTYILFALTLGFAAAVPRGAVEPVGNAHRI
jgi:hypothetical protein